MWIKILSLKLLKIERLLSFRTSRANTVIIVAMIFWILTGFMGESAEDGLRLCIEFCVLVSGCLFFALSLLVLLLPVLLQ